MPPQIILASASPRRSELLRQIGIRHLIQAVDLDESPWPGEAALDYVQRVAAEKSAACCVSGSALVIAIELDDLQSLILI